MGTLTPRVPLGYERVDGIVYSKEVGNTSASRRELGWNYDARTEDGRPLIDHIRDSQLWGKIRRAATTNPALQNALEQCIIIYHLSNPPTQSIQHHPV